MYRNHAKCMYRRTLTFDFPPHDTLASAIDELVGKYRRRNMARKSAVQAQKAVLSWAKNKKRARSDDEEPAFKRSREDSDDSSS